MIKYQMEDNIFTVVFTGAVSFESIISYLKDFGQMEDLPRNLKLLYNFIDAEFDLDPVRIQIISDKAIEVTASYDKIQTAFVVAEPKITAYSMLFSLMSANEKSLREIFSTISAAKNWLTGLR